MHPRCCDVSPVTFGQGLGKDALSVARSNQVIKIPPFLAGMYLFLLIVVEELASEEF